LIEVEFEPRDILSLELALKNLDAAALLKDEWMPFMARVIEVSGAYPPVPAGSKYIRTFHLNRSWDKEVINPLTAQVLNNAIYAGYVVGHEQTAMHAGTGWKHAFDEASRLLDFLAQKLWEKAERIWTA